MGGAATPRSLVLQVTYVGHATMLLELEGVRVLTDPNFDPRLGGFLPRVTAAAITPAMAPPVDVVLITHGHFDHLSFASLRSVAPTTRILAPAPLAGWIRRHGHSAEAIEAGESIEFGGVKILAGRARHSGARYGVDQWRGRSNFYLLRGELSGKSCLFAGDTGLDAGIVEGVERELSPRSAPLDLALLPIGKPPWWKERAFRRGHLTADDALALFEQLGARYLIPYHWGAFRHLTAGPFAAIHEMRERLQRYEHAHRVLVLQPGASLDV